MNKELEEDNFGLDEVQAIFRDFEAGKFPLKETEEDQEKKQSSAEEELEEPEDQTENPLEDQAEEEEEESQLEEENRQKEQKKALEPSKDRENRKLKNKAHWLNERLKQEQKTNEELKQMLEDSLYVGSEFYSQNALFKQEKVKEKIEKALDEGDKKALIDSLSELSMVNEEIARANRIRQEENKARENYKAKESYREDYRENYAAEAEDEGDDVRVIQGWIKDNPEINPESKYFNEKLAAKFRDVALDLDDELTFSGRADLMLSDAYFRRLDKELSKLKSASRRSISSPNLVGGVRNSSYSGASVNASSPKRVVLSKAELEICDSSNGAITREDYIKYKLEQSKDKDRR